MRKIWTWGLASLLIFSMAFGGYLSFGTKTGATALDTTPPSITAASATIATKSLVGIVGKNNTISFILPVTLNDTDMITDFSIKASSDTKEMSVSALGLSQTVTFTNGVANVTVSQLLGTTFDPQGDGVSVGSLRTSIGSQTLTITGTIKDQASNSTSVTLKLQAALSTQAVTFPDSNLAAALRTALNKPSGNITIADMLSLNTLDAQNKGIQNLDGLQYALNLTTLNLNSNSIDDISYLSTLSKLTSLNLSTNHLVDITPLSYLISLNSLLLTHNNINNIDALVQNSGLATGDTVDITYNEINILANSTNLTQIKALTDRGVNVTYIPQSNFPDQPPTNGEWQDANNLTHAYDKNLNTSANILTSTGYITYKLSDIGLTPSVKSYYTISTMDGSTRNVQLEYLRENKNAIRSDVLEVSGYKNEYFSSSIPANAVYVKIYGTGVPIWIYEISPTALATTDPSSGTDSPDYKGANNLADGHDGKENTSANILTSEGYIIYKLSDLGLSPGNISKYLINASDGSSKSITLNYLASNKQTSKGTDTLAVSGFKKEYTSTIPANSVYLKINGVSGAAVYIYELSSSTGIITPGPTPPEPLTESKNANNLADGHDGKDSTSANIFTSDGYIIYKLSDLGLSGGAVSKYIINASDGSNKTITLNYLDTNKTLLTTNGTGTLTVSGYKNEYTATIPATAVYVKINGISGAAVYIYELSTNSGGATPPPSAPVGPSKHANNLDHGHDGNTSTSANIFTSDGYITYSLAELHLTAGSVSKYVINASDGSNKTIILNYLDAQQQPLASNGTGTLTVSGFKNEYTVSIPVGTAYIKINGVAGAAVYIYELGDGSGSTTPSSPGKLYNDANNLPDGHDGRENTSANIFTSSGYIIYSLSELGLTAGSNSKFILNANDGSNITVNLEYLDQDKNQLATGGTGSINVSGFKNEYSVAIPAGTSYVKIKGSATNAIYIYEITH